MRDRETVRARRAPLPEVGEGTSYGTPPPRELVIESWRERAPTRMLAVYDASEAQRARRGRRKPGTRST
jgi:hypothetical protein